MQFDLRMPSFTTTWEASCWHESSGVCVGDGVGRSGEFAVGGLPGITVPQLEALIELLNTSQALFYTVELHSHAALHW